MAPQERAQYVRRQDAYYSKMTHLNTALCFKSRALAYEDVKPAELLQFIRVGFSLLRVFKKYDKHSKQLGLLLWMSHRLEHEYVLACRSSRYRSICYKYLLALRERSFEYCASFGNVSPLLKHLDDVNELISHRP